MATPGTSTPGQRALAEAARMETARVYGTTCREPARERPAVVQPPFARPVDTYYGAAPAADIRKLVAAVTDPVSRVRIEQALARGWTDERIERELHVTVEDVHLARRALDRSA